MVKKFKPDALRGLRQVTDGRFEADGSGSAQMILPGSLCLQPGWYEVTAEVDCRGGHLSCFLGFQSNPEGNEPGEKVFATFEKDSGRPQLVHLIKGRGDIVLEPVTAEETYSIRTVNFRKLGRTRLLYRIFANQLRGVREDPLIFLRKVKRAFNIFREQGTDGIKSVLLRNRFSANYSEWVKKFDTWPPDRLKALTADARRADFGRKISVVMPVFNTDERWLRRAIDSVLNQVYDNWELCVADDCSTCIRTGEVLAEYAQRDSRIRVTRLAEKGHIAGASNSAISMCTGDLICFLDHDDELAPHALYCLAKEANYYPGARLFYSDEDKITADGVRHDPHFKSDWNPELLLSQNYVCHLMALELNLVKELGGFRKEVPGAQDWDLVLRASGILKSSQIRHIPRILYHWRSIESSTASSTLAKPYVLESQKKAVSDYLLASREPFDRVEVIERISQIRVRRSLPSERPLVSIVIPTKDKHQVLERCIHSILEKTSYKTFEIVIIDNGSLEEETRAAFSRIEALSAVRLIESPGPFNFSKLNNTAVRECRGSILAFLNNDLEVISGDWLSEMVSHAVLKKNGAVGARLIYPNNLVQHAGVITGIGGVAGHSHKYASRNTTGYFNRAVLPQNLSAVTAACLVMRREVFDEVNGFDEALGVAFNDIDLCLRIRAKGYLNVYSAFSELYHYESISRGYENDAARIARFETESALMKSRWSGILASDPYYNPNLTLVTEDFTLAYPPRVSDPV